ncbi:hypothetical protein [Actinomycetospora sp.]|jgi:hypothetical protein|uniref:hypothetical protein n=1 Tax=Actinomycetospora sp. TaxID=1872135 RepID=UPI002F416636
MTVTETFLRADRAMVEAVAGVGGGSGGGTVRPVFATDPPGGTPVGAAVAHLARDEAWIPAMLAGRTMAEHGPDAFDGDLLGADPAAAFARLGVAARDAAGAVADLDAPVHCSFGDCSGEEYLWQLVVARTLGAEALAALAGTPAPVDDELAAEVLTGLVPRAELWRQVGILLPGRTPSSASPRDELLAVAGSPGVPVG